MVEGDVGASRGVQLVVPGATGVFAEAGVFVSMRRGEVVKDPEERVAVGFSGNEVVVDVGEFLRGPEVFGEAKGRMLILGHRQEGRWEGGKSMTRLICTS